MKPFSTDWARTATAGFARSAILRAGFAPLLTANLDVVVEGHDDLSNVAPPAIFIANHTSHLDAPLVLTSLPPEWRRRTAVGAAADYFFDAWWMAAVTALAFNAFPVDRDGRGGSGGLGRRLLAEGWSLLVFPEGTRSRDGAFGRFHVGAAVLAVEMRVPVVPVGIRGAYQAMPPGRGWPVGGRPRVNVRFGRPCRATERERPAAFCRRLEGELVTVLDEERTTWWRATRRAAKPDFAPKIEPPPAHWRRVWESSRPIEKEPDPWAPSVADAGGRGNAAPGDAARPRARHRDSRRR